jgi:hypothetical protein
MTDNFGQKTRTAAAPLSHSHCPSDRKLLEIRLRDTATVCWQLLLTRAWRQSVLFNYDRFDSAAVHLHGSPTCFLKSNIRHMANGGPCDSGQILPALRFN